MSNTAALPASFGPLMSRGCPFCGDSRSEALLANQYFAQAPRDVMAVVECGRCGLIYTNPIPTASWNEKFLDSNPWWERRGWMDAQWQERHELPKFSDGLAILQKLTPSGRLIDIGTGPGFFVRLARAAGYDACGFDVLAQDSGSNDTPILTGSIADLPSASFDALTLWCVVAHEPDFMDLLRNCHRILRTGGVALIETPNMTLWRRLVRPRRILERLSLRTASHDVLGAHGHVNHFTGGTLEAALSQCGFGGIEPHCIRGYGEQSAVNVMKRALFMLSAGRVNLCHPLVVTARKIPA